MFVIHPRYWSSNDCSFYFQEWKLHILKNRPSCFRSVYLESRFRIQMCSRSFVRSWTKCVVIYILKSKQHMIRLSFLEMLMLGVGGKGDGFLKIIYSKPCYLVMKFEHWISMFRIKSYHKLGNSTKVGSIHLYMLCRACHIKVIRQFLLSNWSNHLHLLLFFDTKWKGQSIYYWCKRRWEHTLHETSQSSGSLTL